MKLHILGTGNGDALNCYNSCFAIENNNKFLLVDGGGGNQILKQLKLANIELNKISSIFLSHNHTDHILGIVWVLRHICQKMRHGNYEGNLNIYASDESINTLKVLIELVLPTAKLFENRIIFNVVKNGQVVDINNLNIAFFDICAKKEKQFGFVIDNKLAFCGDEPLKQNLFDFVKNKEWLIHESFCLDSEEDVYLSHPKGHCTVKEASLIAKEVNAKNLIILHTEDNNLLKRKNNYSLEAKKYFNGNVFVPDDLEVFEI